MRGTGHRVLLPSCMTTEWWGCQLSLFTLMYGGLHISIMDVHPRELLTSSPMSLGMLPEAHTCRVPVDTWAEMIP